MTKPNTDIEAEVVSLRQQVQTLTALVKSLAEGVLLNAQDTEKVTKGLSDIQGALLTASNITIEVKKGPEQLDPPPAVIVIPANATAPKGDVPPPPQQPADNLPF